MMYLINEEHMLYVFKKMCEANVHNNNIMSNLTDCGFNVEPCRAEGDDWAASDSLYREGSLEIEIAMWALKGGEPMTVDDNDTYNRISGMCMGTDYEQEILDIWMQYHPREDVKIGRTTDDGGGK